MQFDEAQPQPRSAPDQRPAGANAAQGITGQPQHGREKQSPSSSTTRPAPRRRRRSPSRRDRETETERGKREGATASRTASAPQHIAPEPVTQQEHPSPSRRLEKLTPAAVPESLPELPAPPPFQFCFWRENRTGAPKPRRNTEERRPPADAAHQRKGEPLHFGLQRLSQISTQYHHHHTLTPKISSVTRSV